MFKCCGIVYKVVESCHLKLIDTSMTNIQLIKGSGEVKLTSIRIYHDTWEKWKDFCKGNDEYSALDILNTALLDFMNRYK